MDSLCSALRHVLKLDLDSDRTKQVAQATVLYLCGVTDAYEYQHYMKANVRFRDLDISAKDFRLMLVEKSYFTLNIKFYALNLCKATMNAENLQHFTQAFDIVRNDAVMLRRVFEDRRFRREMRASERLKEISLPDIDEDSVARTQADFNDMYQELMKHIRQKTFKKLRFLVKAENTEFSDFNGELLYKALKAYYMIVPTQKTTAHVLNYLRSTCTNHALNIIGMKTSDKRRRMVNAGSDGFGGSTFSYTCVSENQLASADGEESLSYEGTLNDQNQFDNSSMLSELNFERVVQQYGRTTMRRRAIQIVAGQDDSRFTRYLRVREFIRHEEDCTDFVTRTKHENVVVYLADHLGVPTARLEKFLKKVGTELIKHRSVA
ncbi:hypothetical protein D3C85_370170 [compost metagenome]